MKTGTSRILWMALLAGLFLSSGLQAGQDEDGQQGASETADIEQTGEAEAEPQADVRQRPARPPAPDVLVTREEYDNRCSEIAFRMAMEPGSLTLGELERLNDCIRSLRSGAAVADHQPELVCSRYCATPAPQACPPPARPNLDVLCPPYMEQQRQERSDERRQRQVRPHIPGL